MCAHTHKHTKYVNMEECIAKSWASKHKLVIKFQVIDLTKTSDKTNCWVWSRNRNSYTVIGGVWTGMVILVQWRMCRQTLSNSFCCVAEETGPFRATVILVITSFRCSWCPSLADGINKLWLIHTPAWWMLIQPWPPTESLRSMKL